MPTQPPELVTVELLLPDALGRLRRFCLYIEPGCRVCGSFRLLGGRQVGRMEMVDASVLFDRMDVDDCTDLALLVFEALGWGAREPDRRVH